MKTKKIKLGEIDKKLAVLKKENEQMKSAVVVPENTSKVFSSNL